LAHAAGLALSLSHSLDCGSSARRINCHPGSSPQQPLHQSPPACRGPSTRTWEGTLVSMWIDPSHFRRTPGIDKNLGFALGGSSAGSCCGGRTSLVRRLRSLAALAKSWRRD
jgi:hypothetical protein